MTRRAFYKRYPGDWIMGTRDLTLEERGAYSDLVDLMMDRGGPLPDEARWLAGILGVSTKRWNAIRQALLEAGKLQVEDDYLSNRRAMRELGQVKAEVSKQVKWGRMGGKRRAANEKAAREEALKQSQNELPGIGGKPPEETKAPLDTPAPATKPQKGPGNGNFRRVFDEFSSGENEKVFALPNEKREKPAVEGQGPLKPARASHIQSPEVEPKGSSPPAPSRARPKPPRKKPQTARALRTGWTPEPLANGTAELVANWPEGKLEVELGKFLDWVADKGTTSKDWNARWRNWIRKEDADWKRHGSRASGKPSGWNFAANR